MTTSFILQDDVPLPPVKRQPRNPHQPWKDALTQAEVGQFFFVPDRAPKSVSAYVARVSKELDRKFETRRVSAWFDKGGGVWRLCSANAPGSKEGVGVWRTS